MAAGEAGDSSESESDGDEDMDENDEEAGPWKKAKKKGKMSIKEKKKYLRRDMYKVLDGSALLAIGDFLFCFHKFSILIYPTGMIVQYHTASLLNTRIPEGWEEEMELEMERAGDKNVIPRGGKRRRRANVNIEVEELQEEEGNTEEDDEQGGEPEVGAREVDSNEVSNTGDSESDIEE